MEPGLAAEALRHASAKRYDAALECIGRALATDPGRTDLLQLRAGIELALGDCASAIASLKFACDLVGAGADCRKNLVRALAMCGRLKEAAEVASAAWNAFCQDAEIRELAAMVYAQLGAEQAQQGSPAAAVSAYGHALGFKGAFPEAHINLGNALVELGRYADALRSFDTARSIAPDLPEVQFNRGAALLRLGLAEEAVEAYRSAADSGFVPASSALLYVLLFASGDNGDAVWREQKAWVERHAADCRTKFCGARDVSPDRRLRIGYFSRFQASRFFIQALLSSHRREEFEVVCYIDFAGPSAQLEPVIAPTQWRSVAHLNNAELAAQIERDEIDILVDWTGHGTKVRPLVLARKPAPVQVSMSGYPASTGLPSVDYRISDAIADPPGLTEAYHSEELVRLDPCFCCYRPPDDAPPIGELPASRNGYVTFGSFNNPAKLTNAVLATWASVLRACPRSQLLMQYTFGAGDDVPPEYRDRVAAAFRVHSVDPARIRFVGGRSLRDRMALLNDVDIALDPFPYNGATTTCETLWMGVPVLALAGQTYVSRVGATLLTAVGLPDWVAPSRDAYVELAACMAADGDGLRRLRAELRPRMATSALTNGPAYTRALEQAFRWMWRRWCAGRHSG